MKTHPLTKTQTILHVILFFVLYSFIFFYVQPHFSIKISFFQALDQLIGQPSLIKRITAFLLAFALYLFFTVIWEHENWKKAFFIRNPIPGFFLGMAYALVVVMLGLILLIITKVIVMQGFITNIAHTSALLGAWFIAQIFSSAKEELIYRGYLLRRLVDKFNPHICNIIVALVFGIGHFAQYHLMGFIFAAIAGLTLGYVYLSYKNIYVAIGMHLTWDIFSHTLLAGKLIAFQIGYIPSWINPSSAYISILLIANLLFLVGFFFYKQLWRI